MQPAVGQALAGQDALCFPGRDLVRITHHVNRDVLAPRHSLRLAHLRAVLGSCPRDALLVRGGCSGPGALPRPEAHAELTYSS